MEPTADVLLRTPHQRSPHSPSIRAPSPASPLRCSVRGCHLPLGPVTSSLCKALQVGDDAVGTCRQSGAQTKRLQALAPPAFRGNQGWGRRLHVCRLSLATAHQTQVTTSAKQGGPVPGHRGWGQEVVQGSEHPGPELRVLPTAPGFFCCFCAWISPRGPASASPAPRIRIPDGAESSGCPAGWVGTRSLAQDICISLF